LSDTCSAVDAQKPPKPDSRGRSRITNGKAFVPGVDGRSTWVRRARDVQAQLVQDRGGAGLVSAAEALIMRRAAILEAELERLEGIFAAAGEADGGQLGLYQTCANTQRRLLEAIGLERRARDVTPSLEQYATHLRAQTGSEGAGA
jgi:hypothetical protein